MDSVTLSWNRDQAINSLIASRHVDSDDVLTHLRNAKAYVERAIEAVRLNNATAKVVEFSD